MKIVADENIPLVQHYFGTHEIVLKPGRAINHNDLLDADILLVRSVTQVNAALLKNTKVKFVGSATTGSDHIDIEWLKQNNIKWALAEGCNATAVVEYVICVIAALQKLQLLANKKCRAGVIGVGRIGSRVVDVLKKLDFDVVQCDPLRAQNERNFISTSIEEMSDLDFVTLHTPLTKTGPYPTYHLIQQDFFQRQKQDCVLLNTSRGSVINFSDLKLYGENLLWCLDVYEHEPDVDFEVLDLSVIATPHIAGYSVQSKYRGTQMVYEAAVQQQVIPAQSLPAVSFPTREISFNDSQISWQDVVLAIFDPIKLTEQLKTRLVENSAAFDQLRKEFNDRYEFEFIRVVGAKLSKDDENILQQLI